MEDGQTACHRDTVADLVLEVAGKRGQAVEVVEWPGGEPQHVDLDVPPATFKALARGRVTVPLPKPVELADYAGLPWGSVASIHSGDQGMRVISGPATYQRGEWLLPVFWLYPDPDTDAAEIEERAAELRRGWGLERRQSTVF